MEAVTRQAVAVTFADKLADDDALAETGKAMAQAVRTKLGSGDYERLSSGYDLARALQEDARAVYPDLHLLVQYEPPPAEPSAQPSPAPRPPTSDLLRKRNGEIRRAEILDGNVGYMRIDGFRPPAMASEPMTAAFAFLKNTDALIVDVRFNGGGDPETMALLMSFLSEGEPYLVNTFHHREGDRIEEFRTTDLGAAAYGARKPVYVLTSRGTVSGGEEFAYDLKAFKRGLVVGETTRGGANPTRGVDLGHGFLALIPFGRAVNPVTKTNWEGVGVSPDLAVPAEKALPRAQRAALEGLRDIAPDPVEHALLEGLALKFELTETSPADQHFPRAALAGVYAPPFQAPSFTVEESGGQLVLHSAGAPDAILIPVAGDRYRLEGLGSDYFATFLVRDGRLKLLLEQPGAAWILVKQ